jgi:hypothetical protein
MSTKIEAFIAELQRMPKFVAASATDPHWIAELAAIERGLIAIEQKADDDPQMLDAFDKIEEDRSPSARVVRKLSTFKDREHCSSVARSL